MRFIVIANITVMPFEPDVPNYKYIYKASYEQTAAQKTSQGAKLSIFKFC